MKRSIKLLLCTLAVLLAVPLTMCAAEKLGFDSFALAPKAAAATIVDSGNCGNNVTYTLDSDGLLTISGKGSMYGYSWKSDGDKLVTTAPWGSKKLTQVVISDGVTNIGSSAFDGCTGLTSITIPDSVTSIGSEAFSGCTGLTSITIPDGVTNIGEDAFYNVPNIVYSGNLSGAPWGARALNGYIEDGIVYEDSSKTKLLACPSSREGTVVIPDSVTSIGDLAFDGCTGLTSITIPDSVTSIGEGAFYDCFSLTSVTIPDGVTNIGDYAFYGCSSLTSVTIGNSVTSIDESAFSGCRSLTSITIPDSVTSIGNYAFEDCSSLTSVTIPSGVTSIGYSAFRLVPNIVYSGTASGSPWGARALNGYIEDGIVYEDSSKTKLLACPSSREGTVVIPDCVTSIGERAFEYCESLTSITIPNSVTSIGDGAFSGCSGLASITIPDGVTSIGWGTFSGCSSLTSITIPDGVTSIGEDAFYNVPNIVYSGNLSGAPWGARALNGFVEDGLVYEDSSKTKLLACSASKEGTVVIPSSVTSIGEYAFSHCTGLTSITLPDGVTNIGRGTFFMCSSLTSITIPDGVTSIGANAFRGCSSLTSITIPDSVTSIGDYAFSGCSLTSITIPEGVTSIGGDAFRDCSSLKSITIPEGVTSIGGDEFRGCSSLTSITIPDSVTSIGERAFYECSSMSDVFILNPDSLTEESGESIFANSPITIHSHSGYGVEKYAEKYGYNFVPLHMWDNGTVTREPQVGVAGERTFTCTVCSATRTEEIAPLVPTEPDRIEVKSSDSAKELNDGIVGATHSVTVSELLASSNASYVVDKDGNRITETTNPLATGMKIILESGGERLEKVISVLGDVNGDGEISVSDARGALRAAVGLDTLEGAYLNAARVNGADEVAVSDARSILRAAVALDTGKDWLANIK